MQKRLIFIAKTLLMKCSKHNKPNKTNDQGNNNRHADLFLNEKPHTSSKESATRCMNLSPSRWKIGTLMWLDIVL